MNSALTDNQAAGKAVRIAHLVLRGALACALIVGGGAVAAQQYGSDRGSDRGSERRDDVQQAQSQQHQGRERFTLPQQDRGQRENGARPYDDQVRGGQSSPQGPLQYGQGTRGDDTRRPGSGRLTPDERRDLRRQINEAGMDLYPRRH